MKNLMLAAMMMAAGAAVGESCIIEGSLERGPLDEGQSAARSDICVRWGDSADWTPAVLDARDVFTAISARRNLDCRPPAGMYIIIH